MSKHASSTPVSDEHYVALSDKNAAASFPYIGMGTLVPDSRYFLTEAMDRHLAGVLVGAETDSFTWSAPSDEMWRRIILQSTATCYAGILEAPTRLANLATAGLLTLVDSLRLASDTSAATEIPFEAELMNRADRELLSRSSRRRVQFEEVRPPLDEE